LRRPDLAATENSFREGRVKPAAIPSDADLAEALIAPVLEAGRIVMKVRETAFAVEKKSDHSPVTEADRAAEAAICARLSKIAPGVPVVAEEACAAGLIPSVGREFFLIDPLDGTKEYVKGGDDFTVNIALIRDHVPVVGLILAPATGELCVGVAGKGAWTAQVVDGAVRERRPIRVRPPAAGRIDVVASKSHRTPETDAYIARYKVGELVSAGSSLKFCLVASGKADLYPRLGTTMQWDTAAGDAILRAAGGKVVTLDGAPLRYGPSRADGAAAYRNPWFIAASGMALVL
jgi:3'(2'), 5'-bisphosphate nucleotidase